MRFAIRPTAMFSTMSGGAVSVPIPMRIPIAFSFEKDLSAEPCRAETSGQWATVTPFAA
ncbi:hypothetical protein D3C87_2023010 [compost metagenome]